MSPNGEIVIYNNAPGCNSQEDILDSRWVSINEQRILDDFSTHPNTFTTPTTLEYTLSSTQTVIITFYNSYGKKIDVITDYQQQGLQKLV